MKAIFIVLLIITMTAIFPLPIESNQIPAKIKFQELKLKILNCESGLKHHNIWGDHHKAYGIAQFHLRTFNYLINKEGNNLTFATDLIVLKKRDILKISIKE